MFSDAYHRVAILAETMRASVRFSRDFDQQCCQVCCMRWEMLEAADTRPPFAFGQSRCDCNAAASVRVNHQHLETLELTGATLSMAFGQHSHCQCRRCCYCVLSVHQAYSGCCCMRTAPRECRYCCCCCARPGLRVLVTEMWCFERHRGLLSVPVVVCPATAPVEEARRTGPTVESACCGARGIDPYFNLHRNAFNQIDRHTC